MVDKVVKEYTVVSKSKNGLRAQVVYMEKGVSYTRHAKKVVGKAAVAYAWTWTKTSGEGDAAKVTTENFEAVQ